MSKRFTDTEKWKKIWFRKLSPKYKCAWQFLLDTCDHAGVWHEDFEAMSFHVGEDIGVEEFESIFKGRIERIDEDKYFLTSFIKFQYGDLRDNNSVHLSVMRTLGRLGVSFENETGYSNRPSAVLSRLSEKKKREVFALDHFKCTYCGVHGDERTLAVDHIHPRSKGGDNADSNLTTACSICNSKKSDLDAEEFIRRHKLELIISESLNDKLRSLNGAIKELSGAKDKEEDKAKAKDMEKAKEEEKEKEDGTIPADILNTIKCTMMYPDEIIEEVRKDAWLKYQASDKVDKNWKRWIGNYFLNEKEKIRTMVVGKGGEIKTANNVKQDAQAMASRMFDTVISTGRNDFKNIKWTPVEAMAADKFGRLSEILSCTDFQMQEIKTRLRNACEESLKINPKQEAG